MGHPELEKLLKQWGAPPRAARIALDGATETAAIGHVRSFLNDYSLGTSNIMVLAGGVGVGKTVAATWAMVHLPMNTHSSYGTRRFRHISQLCEIGLYGGDEAKRERDILKGGRMLVLDDVGTEHMTETFQTMFDGLINARYEDDGATIITTNLSSETFRERYGVRIYDRLRGRGAWFEISHESLRG